MNIYEKLMNIQTELNCPKDLYNKFGKYAYRNTESILEALKPLLLKYKVIINITDKIELVGDRHYVKATAKVMDIEKGEEIMSTAYAREASEQSGMQASQLSGSTSSYARKYALNGLFAIDDTKDADTTNTHGKESVSDVKTGSSNKVLSEGQIKRLYAIANSGGVDSEKVKEQLKSKFNKEVSELTKVEYDLVCKGYEGLKK